MKKVGEVLKQARKNKKFSKTKLEDITKIRKSFISSIEKNDWKSLPEFPVVSGFVKSLSGALDLDVKQISALLRRDYPPKNLPINPKPDLVKKFVWSPRLTFIIGAILISAVVLVYLAIQYAHFINPPTLQIYEPKEEQVVNSFELDVVGKTDSESTVKVNNQPVIVDDDGNFSTVVEINSNTTDIRVVAKSRSGKETVVTRKIKPEL